jgi:hypothetical protein
MIVLLEKDEAFIGSECEVYGISARVIGNPIIPKRLRKESRQYEGPYILGEGISGGGGVGRNEDPMYLRASCSLMDVQVRLSASNKQI